MKPVDPAVTSLIYTSGDVGRKTYLNTRIKSSPDQRFYFPEVSSFVYGWKMWYHNNELKKLGFGREMIIKHTFYRRRGVTHDPDWYKEPAAYSPTVCNCTWNLNKMTNEVSYICRISTVLSIVSSKRTRRFWRKCKILFTESETLRRHDLIFDVMLMKSPILVGAYELLLSSK